ncbi:MAG TPA: GNAT family N-acetyltransferase [Candidatus Thermoplasmatota archaeon]|nr:GNAT family N-acetyltransferase [Candidatus Thermoplasmatota archaeon]
MIRAAGPGDLSTLLALERACFPPGRAYHVTEYRDALARPDAVNLGVVLDGAVRAFAGAVIEEGGRVGHLFTIHVHPDERRRGHARALLAALEDRLRARDVRVARLEVATSNDAALALYRAAGYAEVGAVPGYYALPDEDAVRMEKAL